MGKGDIKTKKGKRKAGSSGVSRPRKTAKPIVISEKKPKPAKKAAKVAKASPAKKKTSTAKKAKADK